MQPKEDTKKDKPNAAADLIRGKLDKLYGVEPDAEEEKAEVEALPAKKLSKHQQYMKDLSDSGRGLAEIQVAWHEYYGGLDNAGKHEVWQEFYSEHERAKKLKTEDEKSAGAPKSVAKNETIESVPITTQRYNPVSHNTASMKKRNKTPKQKQSRAGRTKEKFTPDLKAANDVRQHLLGQIQARSEITRNPHARALVFGLSMGSLTLFVLLFGFFNERFITPFIRPNSSVSATPIIVDPGSNGPVGPEAKIIIPKINVEAPVVYDVPSIEEKDVQKGLEGGVVHYTTTPNPGEKGNSVIFGHSSSNILNKGKYKFAFILLKSLDKEDTFIVQKDGKRYVYKVYNKFVTKPDDLSVIGPTDKSATMTLITCDPPGTSTNRLIVQAEQIFPDPGANPESKIQQASAQPKQLAGNSESLWHRFINGF